MAFSTEKYAPAFLSNLAEATPCARLPKLFHPAGTHRRGLRDPDAPRRPDTSHEQAIAACGDCPVRFECRQWARENGEFGIWGGETDDEREAAGFPVRVRGSQPRRSQAGRQSGYRAPRRPDGSEVFLTAHEELVLEVLRMGHNRLSAGVELGKSNRSITRAINSLATKLHTDENGIVAAAVSAGLFEEAPGPWPRGVHS
ncbi:WhiB family transcriptional regulator [Streptomyces sp. NPDC089919]|uniref:WhiB family transcriptional regulator n=1 Tax=Streptomyces sp. NPDC089919 TaxID=3155188 RepID=UPI003432D64D